jgi:hypothetical protein
VNPALDMKTPVREQVNTSWVSQYSCHSLPRTQSRLSIRSLDSKRSEGMIGSLRTTTILIVIASAFLTACATSKELRDAADALQSRQRILTSNDLRLSRARRRRARRERSMFPKVRHSVGDRLDEEKQSDHHRRTFEVRCDQRRKTRARRQTRNGPFTAVL